MPEETCPHKWTAETKWSTHIVYCEYCGLEMSRETLILLLNVADKLARKAYKREVITRMVTTYKEKLQSFEDFLVELQGE